MANNFALDLTDLLTSYPLGKMMLFKWRHHFIRSQWREKREIFCTDCQKKQEYFLGHEKHS